MTVYIVTGPKHSGKTTRLAAWCRQQEAVGGLLSPVVAGQRLFRDIVSGKELPMEAPATETKVQEIGRYRFSDAAFTRASQALMQSLANPAIRTLVIDEVGPLELKGFGFHPFLQTIFSLPGLPKNVVLVIREELTEAVRAYYKLNRFPVKILSLSH